MRVLLVANYQLSNQQSMQRFASMLEQGLVNSGHEVKVIRPEAIACRGVQAESGLNKWLGYIDRFILFRSQLKKVSKWGDVVHICDHSNAMYAKWVKNTPVLVTCHDLMAIQSGLGMVDINPTGFNGRLLQKWIVSGLAAADHISCVSENTQNELLKTIQIDKNKTSVAYNALNYPYLPMPKNQALELINERLPELQEPFFFHLGGNQWYKNRKGVAEIFSHIAQFSGYQKHLLILAGKQWPQDLQEKIKTLGIEDRVIAISDLSNEEVRAFYSTCEAMIFPSLEEGFGWPIAEAQACGAIVVTTNRAPMTEVGGNAAINIEPENPKASAEVIVESLSKENDLKKLGIENAKRFSTEEMIQSYLDGYQIAVNLKRVG